MPQLQNPEHIMKDCKQLTKSADKASNLYNRKEKWCTYYCSNGHSNEDYYQKQSEGEYVNRDNRKIWCNYLKTGSQTNVYAAWYWAEFCCLLSTVVATSRWFSTLDRLKFVKIFY